nr:hypothetical protein [Tanacetum cinerariifolium]
GPAKASSSLPACAQPGRRLLTRIDSILKDQLKHQVLYLLVLNQDVDPLAYLASTTHHLTPTQPTNPSPSTSSLTLPPQLAAQSSNDAMLATMN